MKEVTESFLAGLASGLLVALISGTLLYAAGIDNGGHAVRMQAVRHGCARWEPDEEGRCDIVWLRNEEVSKLKE